MNKISERIKTVCKQLYWENLAENYTILLGIKKSLPFYNKQELKKLQIIAR